MTGLTPRQYQVFDFIRGCIAAGRPPTMREIATHLGIRSINGINDHLRALESKGYLRRDSMKARGLALSGPDIDAQIAYHEREAERLRAVRDRRAA